MLQGAAREAVYWMRPSRPLRGARGRRDEIQNQDKSCLCYLRHGLMENRNGQVAAAEATLATELVRGLRVNGRFKVRAIFLYSSKQHSQLSRDRHSGALRADRLDRPQTPVPQGEALLDR